MASQHASGYRLALHGSHDVDWYLDRRGPGDAAEFERGWFDALEDYSAMMMDLLRRNWGPDRRIRRGRLLR